MIERETPAAIIRKPVSKTLRRGRPQVWLAQALKMVAWASLIFIPPGLVAVSNARSPNVVVIVADDLGYADVGFNGGTQIKTPNIDALAAQGTIFTSAYATSAVCSPSRAGIMTGRYPQRFGHENNQPRGYSGGLPLSQVTMADMMRAAGYATAAIGKWHLGGEPALVPNNRGFDYFYGFYDSASNYLPPITLRRNGKVEIETKRYLTTAFGDEAARFIHDNKDRPFFLYLGFNAPHVPLAAPSDYLKRYLHIKDPKRRTYAAMVSGLDDAVGVVAQALRIDALSDRTLMIFLSDNGGASANGASNFPLRGGKPQPYEGGIRVPFFVRWPNGLLAGQKYALPVSSLDVFTTVAAAAEAKLPPVLLDGVNLLPYIRGKVTTAPHRSLFWRMDSGTAMERFAARVGPLKLVNNPLETTIFNLGNDIGETHDVKTPQTLVQLQEAYDKWESQMIAPLW
jgi:arylsulfatase A-like enzyme